MPYNWRHVFLLALLATCGAFFLSAPHHLSPGCGGSGGAEGGAAAGETNFVPGPVEMPVTIAKAIDGVDSASLAYDDDSGILTGTVLNEESGIKVAAFINGVRFAKVTTTTGGNFEITGITPPVTIALVVLSNDEQRASPEVIADINADDVMQVALTNIGSIEAGSGIEIVESGNSSANVYFVTTDQDDNPVIGRISTQGGGPSGVADLDSIPILAASNEDLLITFSPDSDEIISYSLDDATFGNATTVGTTLSDSPVVDVNPNGDVAYTTDTDNKLVAINDDSLSIPSDGVSITSQIFGWGSNDLLNSYQTLTSGTYRMQEFNVVTGGSATDASFGTSCSEINCGSTYCALVCENSGESSLYTYATADGFILANADAEFSNPHVGSGDIVAAELNTGSSVCSGTVGVVDTSTGELTNSGSTGCFPKMDPMSTNLVHYLCEINETTQVCVFNAGGSSGGSSGGGDDSTGGDTGGSSGGGDDSTDGGSGTDGGATQPSKIALTGSSSPKAGACTEYTVTLQDSSGTTTTPSSAVGVTFSGGSNGNFYSDSPCTQIMTTISSLLSSYPVYYKNTLAESVTLRAAATGLTAGTVAVTVTPDSAVKLRLSTSTSASSTTCSSTYFTLANDTNNNETVWSTTSTKTANLSTSNGLGTFYSDPTCETIKATCDFPANESRCPFYFKCGSPINFTITATDSEGTLSSGTNDSEMTCL